MRPTSIPFACAYPLIREQAFPIAFLARPQLLTRSSPLPWEGHQPPCICACVHHLVRTADQEIIEGGIP